MPYKLKPANTSLGRGCLFGVAIFWLGVTSAVFLPMIFLTGNAFSIIPIIMGLIFYAVGIAILILAIKPFIVKMKIEDADVSLSVPEPAIGESFQVSYKQRIKQTIIVSKISIKLLFRETATYQQGTTSTTVTNNTEIGRLEKPGQVFRAGSSIEEQTVMTIPEDGMHSFKSTHNQIQWLLISKVEIEGWPDYECEYEINVPARVKG